MTYITRNFILVIFTVFLATFLPVYVFAQTSASRAPRVYFENTVSEASIGSKITVRVFVDSEKPINVLELKVSYSGVVEPISFNEGNSIIEIWQSKELKNTPGVVVLSGGMSRAFAGTKGEIGTITFKTTKEGVAKFAITEANLYYADGKGTRATNVVLGTKSVTIREVIQNLLQPVENVTESVAPLDTESPIFGITDTLQNEADRTRIAIFQVTDNGSGIESITMRSMKWFTWNEWSTVSNPAKLPPRIWRYQISAQDNSGNTATHNAYVGIEILKLLGIAILSFTFLIAIIYFIIRR